jgi:DNA polymerase III epsilon subunit-like protein
MKVPPDLAKVSIVDVESCGLHHGSYPIEVGICDLDLDMQSRLIRPHSSWDKWNWSFSSEKVHGISRDTLLSGGHDLVEVATFLNERLSGRIVLSDAVSNDEKWLHLLFAAADLRMEFEVEIFDEAMLLTAGGDVSVFERVEGVTQAVSRVFPYIHRAGPDALHMAAVFKALASPSWLRELEIEAPKR